MAGATRKNPPKMSAWWPEGTTNDTFRRYTNVHFITEVCERRDDLPAAPSMLREAYDDHVRRGKQHLCHLLFADSGEEGVCPLEWLGDELHREYRCVDGVYSARFALGGAASQVWRELSYPEWLSKADKELAASNAAERVECINREDCPHGRFFERHNASPLSPAREDFGNWTCPECIVCPLTQAMEE